MPDLSFCSRSNQPKIFFSICLLLSVGIVVITTIVFYHLDGLGISSGEKYDFEPMRSGVREFRGKMISPPDGDSLMDVDGDVVMMEYGETDYQFKNTDFDEEEQPEEDGSITKLRHQAHLHGKQILTLEELNQKPVMSNVIESRLLHLDLKGAPPKVSYLKEVMKLAKKAGINGLLLEWEDTFPFTSSLSNASLTDGGYTLEEVHDLIEFAEKSMRFEVIPLVQTFGHVEFILKGPEFQNLREVEQDPQSFCPSKPDTIVLIKELIDQILKVHKNSRFLHIGMDEVYNLRVCPLCTSASEYREDLFLSHVTEVARYVRSQKRIPIIWDDMLRVISLRRLNESGIGSLVEPMVWVYAEDVDRFVGWESWERYSSIFPTIWGAAAFKGAFGETLMIPPLSRHADNVDRWINVIARESPKWNQGVGGIVLTGWSRYDHFSVLCELLPASIPSLIYNSLLVSVPGGSATSIKNRMFVPKYTKVEPTTVLPSASTSSASSVLLSSSTSESLKSSSDDEIEPTPPSPNPNSHVARKRSPPNYRRKIAHPRILMTKDRLSRLSSHGDMRSRELSTAEIYDKSDHVSKEFCQILHCPNYHTKLDALLKGSESDLSFASRCNFPGVAFFRTLFRLRSAFHDTWETVAKIERKRGWVTPYNIRHNYSLPLRVNEVVFSEVPRLRRQLEVVVKSVETSLKPIFRQEVILEWIEQIIWPGWQALAKLEKDGEILKNVNVWPRRPIQSPWQMIQDLKLSRFHAAEQQDEL